MNIASRHEEYTKKVYQQLEKLGYRVKIDLRNEKIGFKIHKHSMKCVPYLLIADNTELEDQTIAVRSQKGEDLGCLSIIDLVAKLSAEITDRK